MRARTIAVISIVFIVVAGSSAFLFGGYLKLLHRLTTLALHGAQSPQYVTLLEQEQRYPAVDKVSQSDFETLDKELSALIAIEQHSHQASDNHLAYNLLYLGLLRAEHGDRDGACQLISSYLTYPARTRAAHTLQSIYSDARMDESINFTLANILLSQPAYRRDAALCLTRGLILSTDAGERDKYLQKLVESYGDGTQDPTSRSELIRDLKAVAKATHEQAFAETVKERIKQIDAVEQIK